jgi:hypothetical protein
MENKLTSTPFEPKQENRFKVVFPEELNILPYVVKSITKPKHNGVNWCKITVKFIDIICPSTSQAIYNLYKEYGEKYSDDYLFKINIEALGPDGKTVEDWEIAVSYIDKVDFGEMNNDSDVSNTITLVLGVREANLLY